jgi:hypothetical protein
MDFTIEENGFHSPKNPAGAVRAPPLPCCYYFERDSEEVFSEVLDYKALFFHEKPKTKN